MKGRYLVVVAVAVFLLFMGMTGYQILCPITRWTTDCFDVDGTDAGMADFANENLARKSVEQGDTSGLRCDVLTTRKCFGQTFIRRHRHPLTPLPH